jgi:K+-sensing histidine kinase KdpD
MAAILSAAIFPVMVLQNSMNIVEEILIALVLGAVATALFGPTKKGLEFLIDKFFYKDRYYYRQIIQDLSTSLNSLKELDEVSRLVVGTTVKTLNLAGGCLLLRVKAGSFFDIKTSQGTFTNPDFQEIITHIILKRSSQIVFPNPASSADPDISFIIPLTAGENEIGFLCLSQKVTKQTFSSNDIYLLQGLASVAAAALRSATLIHDVSLRNTFISIASHELRTPLTPIMGFSELLLKRDPSEETRKRWVKLIFENSQTISKMVDDLLNVSRIQSGNLSMKLETVKISDIFKERLDIVTESTDKHEFSINVERAFLTPM